MRRWVGTEHVTQGAAPISGFKVYKPIDPIPNGWFFVGYSLDSSKALLVKPALSGKTGRNAAVAVPTGSNGMSESGFNFELIFNA